MCKLIFSSNAKSDLELLLAYSLDTFGRQQTQQYLFEIKKELARLTSMTTIGHRRNDLPEEYYSFKIEQHVFVYNFNESTLQLVIIRILHSKMDFTKKF